MVLDVVKVAVTDAVRDADADGDGLVVLDAEAEREGEKMLVADTEPVTVMLLDVVPVRETVLV